MYKFVFKSFAGGVYDGVRVFVSCLLVGVFWRVFTCGKEKGFEYYYRGWDIVCWATKVKKMGDVGVFCTNEKWKNSRPGKCATGRELLLKLNKIIVLVSAVWKLLWKAMICRGRSGREGIIQK